MQTIQDLVLHRRDGKLITEDMRPQDVARLGKIEPVIKATWRVGEADRSIMHGAGLGVKLVTGRHCLAVNFNLESDARRSVLAVIDADGTRRFVVPDTQTINAKAVTGRFVWAEDAVPPAPDRFSAMFDHPNGALYRLVIDARDGTTLAAMESR